MSNLVARDARRQLPQDLYADYHEPFGLVTVDTDRMLLHEGRIFSAQTTITVLASEVAYILSIVPSNMEVHMLGTGVVVSVPSGAIDVDIELYEGVTSDTTTGNVTAYNMERNSTRAATFLINNNPDTVTDGTLMPMSKYIDTPNQTYSVDISLVSAYEMKYGTKYARKITNNGAQTATITLIWRWYEVDATA